jgi:hypothetical protein
MDEKELYEYKFTVIDEDIDEIDATLKKHEFIGAAPFDKRITPRRRKDGL